MLAEIINDLGAFALWGIGIHTIIALFFAVHAVKHGEPLYWLWILFAFPILGSIVYFFAIYWPSTKGSQGMRRAQSNTVKFLNPNKELKAAKKQFEQSPSAYNKTRYANALLARNQIEQAVMQYQQLDESNPNDVDIKLHYAQALLKNKQADKALKQLQDIRTLNDKYKTSEVGLTAALACAQLGNQTAAQQQFEYVIKQGEFDAKVEYFVWAVNNNQPQVAQHLNTDIQNTIKHWTPHAKAINKPYVKQYKAALTRLN